MKLFTCELGFKKTNGVLFKFLNQKLHSAKAFHIPSTTLDVLTISKLLEVARSFPLKERGVQENAETRLGMQCDDALEKTISRTQHAVLCAQHAVHGALDSGLERLRGPAQAQTGGTGAGFGEHQLVKRMREAQQKRESWVDCARGDTLKILEFADMVEAAFAQSDARWHESLKGYLGSSAVVEQADAASVRVRHADGQTLWWPYGAVKVVSRQPGTHSRQVLSVVTAYRKHAGR